MANWILARHNQYRYVAFAIGFADCYARREMGPDGQNVRPRFTDPSYVDNSGAMAANNLVKGLAMLKEAYPLVSSFLFHRVTK